MILFFWAGGAAAYARGLREHYDTKLSDLNALLSECQDEAERTRLISEISETQDEYHDKIKDIPQLLF